MEPIENWDEYYKHATEQFGKSQTTAEYRQLRKINLERTADLDIWRPSEYVLEANPNIENAQIELITSNTDLNLINIAWRREGTLGLVVLGPVIHRKSKPYLIIVTTRHKYYAIDPKGARKGLEFLRLKLRDHDIKFYLTNGLYESDCLYHNFDMDLTLANATCCTGLDVSLMQSMRNKPPSALQMFPQYAVANSRRPTIINKFEKLVETWLDIFKEDIAFHPDQLEHLLERDGDDNLNLTATNVIKKRCGLVLALADKLEYYNWLEISIMSSKSFNCLLRCGPRVQKHIYMNLKEGDCASIFFTHYNGFFNTPL